MSDPPQNERQLLERLLNETLYLRGTVDTLLTYLPSYVHVLNRLDKRLKLINSKLNKLTPRKPLSHPSRT